MAKHQSVTRQSQHKEGDDYGGIEAGASLFPIDKRKAREPAPGLVDLS